MMFTLICALLGIRSPSRLLVQEYEAQELAYIAVTEHLWKQAPTLARDISSMAADIKYRHAPRKYWDKRLELSGIQARVNEEALLCFIAGLPTVRVVGGQDAP